MAADSSPSQHTPSEKGILKRFLHLLSAQGVDGVFNTVFFLYLAWLDSAVFGAVNYALAAGIVVMKVIQFGLYYPLVSDLTSADRSQAPEILNRVNIIKLGLFVPCMLGVIGIGLYRGLSQQTTIALILVCLGFSIEALAETFFADFRVRGRQVQEARIKMASSTVSYVYGFLAAVIGFDLVVISLFKIVSGVVRLGFGLGVYLRDYAATWKIRSDWSSVLTVFRSASVFALVEICGIVYNRSNIFFLESYTGVTGVAYFSATYNILDEVSILASEQFLGWVIFPLLASFWLKDRVKAARLVKSTSIWLMVFSFPVMFFLYTESPLIIGLVYPAEYKDAIWMQQYLVWTILLSFESNLFFYLMMVAGGIKVLLAFSVITTIVNLILNVALVESFGLMGGCLVIILSKLVMTVLTFVYCRFRFGFVREGDFIFPILLGGALCFVFWLIEPYVTQHPAVLISLICYFLFLWHFGTRVLGPMPRQIGSSA